MTQVRKACLDAVPSEIAKQAVVPVPAELMSLQTADTVNAACAQESSLELSVNGIIIRVTEQTSAELLSKVLGVVAHAK